VIFVEGLMPDILIRHFLLEEENIYRELSSLILDVGCATGFFTSKFSDAIGLDISKENLLTAKKFLHNKEFVRAEASYLPFKKECFDGIVSMEVLEHTTNPVKSIEDIYYCLKPKGKYLLTFDVFSPIRPFVKFVVSRFVVVDWHKKTILSDKKDWTMIDEKKILYILSTLFIIIKKRNIRGIITNLLCVLSIIIEKLSRPKNTARKDIGSQHIRVNSLLIKCYIRYLKPLVEVITKNDPLKWDTAGILVLAEKK